MPRKRTDYTFAIAAIAAAVIVASVALALFGSATQ